MKTQQGFTLMNRQEFKTWLMKQNITRKISMIQNHHTWLPSYANFDGQNHFWKVIGMRNSHMFERGWSDIGQHITTFPDGKIIVGSRPLNKIPAGIKGNNSEAICIENLGDFDKGRDEMTKAQRDTIVEINAALNLKFALPPSIDHNVYHHWFDLSTTLRTNGKGNTKTCPGTAFFGGNKIEDAKKNFIPKILKKVKSYPEYKSVFKGELETPIAHGMVVRANALNVRSGPSVKKKWMGSVSLGSIVSIYEKKGRWSRISKDQLWVSSFYLKAVSYGTVIDEDPKGLKIRSGPNRSFRKLGVLFKNDRVLVHEVSDNNWYRIDFLDKWVSGKYVELDHYDTA
ncbi:MAG: SH3 domain-containing protein [Saprospiraceae bacterium]